jgi:PhzF family phenazine biosynthesis protein
MNEVKEIKRHKYVQKVIFESSFNMNTIPIFQIDAFTNRLFAGNPAAVCVLKEWLPETLMQSIGSENNLAETAFIVPKDDKFEIRWFTPTVEVDLCGHATLAAAYVLFNEYDYPDELIQFHSHRSGLLTVKKDGDTFYLDFPCDTLKKIEDKNEIIQACTGILPLEVYRGKTDYMAVIESEFALLQMEPNLTAISKLDARGLIVTAKGTNADFVSRFFAPQSGINEDPVTGSAHTSLIPYWSTQLQKTQLSAQQLSPRGGQLDCTYKHNRCLIGGEARLYLKGEVWVG